MIINKIRRKAQTQRTSGSELAYMIRLSRYVVRADPAELRKLQLHEQRAHVRDLVEYVIAEGRAEEVLASGAINLLGETLENQQAEMMALLHRSHNGAGALDHWVMSWAEGEKPTIDEIQKTIDIFQRCQKLNGCPVIWGYHGDTDNRHVHLVILRIDCKTAARLEAGDGWDIDAAHRAKAVIEDAFPHWKREDGSLYKVINGQLLGTADGRSIGPANSPDHWQKIGTGRKSEQTKSGRRGIDVAARIDQASCEYESESGCKSRQRIALEIAVPIALQSTNWDECHRLLAAEGIALEKVRKGAIFIIDGKPVKASIDRNTSFASLMKRYGDEEFSKSRHKLAAAPPRELWPHDSKRREYYAAKRDHDERRKAIIGRFRAAHGKARGVDKAALNAAIAGASFPPFEAWASGATAADPVEAIAAGLGFAVFEVEPAKAPGNASARTTEFKAIRLNDRVIYYRPSDPPGRPAFIDLGDRILVNAARDHAAVRAALLLLVQNNPDCSVAVFGDRRLKSRPRRASSCMAILDANRRGCALRPQGRLRGPPAKPSHWLQLPLSRSNLPLRKAKRSRSELHRNPPRRRADRSRRQDNTRPLVMTRLSQCFGACSILQTGIPRTTGRIMFRTD
jgi:hypothetical protein